MACAKPQRVSTGATATEATGPARAYLGSTDGDLECLVCREPYSCARPPKLLTCQHPFCAVCLKLLLCIQNDAWSVTCPLCRQATTVPGGLICSLRDQEAVAGRLVWPEVRLCPQGLADSATSTARHPGRVAEEGQDAASVNRVAARRLAAHLLLLALLVALILPFFYPGILRWVLAVIITLALLMPSLFCCHRSSRGSCWPPHGALFCREQKHSEIASIA
ncbi:E3 ubiquitin-protein ligase RNF186 [Lynx canadensis]|uniref:Ring finger protein 186 n=1 Tax=Lynx canadensis TaxID=61383 RepID=A0A667GSM0_LYNCA|nr:E3 ubiquitin-protein ligase RNF186 [Lynx canadensis]